jgi:hypothetical protein
MATVNKDFKIKSGLIVEGTTGTINGYDILTESQASQDFIVGIVGGETLVKSVGTNLSVDEAGLLSLDLVGIVEDVAGTRLTTDGSTLNVDVDGIADDLTGSYDFATNSDVTFAVGAEATNRDAAISSAVTNLESYADQAEADAISSANSHTDNLLYPNGIVGNPAFDLYGSAATAEQNAKDYADDLIDDASNLSTEVWSAYKTSTEIGLAQAAAELHADNAIAALVDSAPATLDTLNELAAALQDNPDIIGDLQDIAAGKQDTLTAGANIDITGATISVTGLTTQEVAEGTSGGVAGPLYFTDTRAVSAVVGLTDSSYYPLAEKSGKAGVFKPDVASTLASESATGSGITTTGVNGQALAINRTTVDTWYDAAGTAQDIVDALDTDDIEEGSTNLYYTDSRATDAAKQVLLDASKTNISITSGVAGLIIEAENGVADSTTDDLSEGEENLYFTDERAVDALEAVVPNFTAVEINSVAKQVAATTLRETAGQFNGYTFLSSEYRSAEFMVKTAQGAHTEISKILLTLDTSNNVAITEYGIVSTGESTLASITATVSGLGTVELKVTTVNNNSTVTVIGTLLV